VPSPASRHYQLIPKPNYTSILLYAKSTKSIYHPPLRPRTEEELERYTHSDKRGVYRRISLFSPVERPALQYEWKGITPPKRRSWRYSFDRMNDLFESGLIEVNESGKPLYYKHYLENTSIEIGSIWDDISGVATQKERSGYSSQQGLDLLERIIQIGSDHGDLVLDPFCGSGTTLVAAEKTGRQWLGCDSLPVACDISASRLSQVIDASLIRLIRVEADEDLAQHLPNRYYVPQATPEIRLWGSINQDTAPKEKDVVKPLVITEGKTDWKHLKIALSSLKSMEVIGDFVDIDFHEYEDEDMGDTELLNMCMRYAKTSQLRKYIFVFDRDNSNLLSKVEDVGQKYKSWGNNVYSFAIPVPSHRQLTPKVSIELFYQDEDLKRWDDNRRRLFLSNEFNPKSGRHLTENLNCMEINKLKEDLKIVDNKVYDQDHQNVALSKDDFANYVLEKAPGFDDVDMIEFKAIIDIIEKINAV
jgi:hypothetical protein